MIDDLAPVPRVALPHLCGGPGCSFCEWSNPTLELPDAIHSNNTQEARTAP